MTVPNTIPDPNDVLMGGGSQPTAKFVNPGDTVGGRIVAPPRAHQEREYNPANPGQGTPKYFPSGDPIFGITVDVQTNLRDDAEDNGIRRIYVEGKRLKEAVRTAVQEAGATKLEVGGELHVTFTGLGTPSSPGVSAPKLYAARYTPAAQAAVFGQQPGAQQPTAQLHAVPAQEPAPQPVAAAQPPAAAPTTTGPSPEQVAALRAAGVDPSTVFPGYTG